MCVCVCVCMFIYMCVCVCLCVCVCVFTLCKYIFQYTYSEAIILVKLYALLFCQICVNKSPLWLDKVIRAACTFSIDNTQYFFIINNLTKAY